MSETNYHSVVGEALPILIDGLTPFIEDVSCQGAAAERVLDRAIAPQGRGRRSADGHVQERGLVVDAAGDDGTAR